MKTKETSPKQIYITVVTSGLTMLANKVARALKPNEDIFDACSELANEIAEENGLDYCSVLVQYFNHYSDKIPAMALKVPSSPFHARRRKAIDWWNNLNLEEKFYKVIAWLKSKEMNVTDRHPHSLTGSEIEEIWIKEVLQTEVKKDIENALKSFNSKPNQKQFKQFDESLFKTYIDKFSKDDKFKALKILWNELNVTEELNETLNNH